MLKLLRLCIFTIYVKVAISQDYGFYQSPTNLGSGINFYGRRPDASTLKIPEVLIFDPGDCSGDFNTGGSSFFNDPGICCEGAEPIQCNYSFPYRKYDGSCNNPYIPRLGMAEMCFLRLTPAYYEGKGGIRKSVTGDPLPQPRNISLNILKNSRQPTREVTYLFTAHGQIIAHDLSRTVTPSTECCAPENARKAECLPISIRPDDPFYSQFNVTCNVFQRSVQCRLCKTVHRTQKNDVTATLDANIVYDINEEQTKRLRTNDGTGKLRSTCIKKGYLLPAGKDKRDPFCPIGQDSNCFLAGDPRVNMHASLTSLQTILMREHNRLATKLREINPHWGEEKLFQEARKILIAEHQCITYKEYLPILLGSRIVEVFDLTVKNGARGTTYYPQILLATFQEFSGAAFRLHSMVPPYIGLSNYRFKDTYSNPSMVRQGCILNITASSYQVLSEKYDHFMAIDLSDYLLQQSGMLYGHDLSANDIQRGRDHGLAPYVEVVKFCSGGTIIISSFEDLYKRSLMPRGNIMLLKSIYSNPDVSCKEIPKIDLTPWKESITMEDVSTSC
ncbi:Chorion peroxidase like protein [Argiope bruennichi]|uniref:Chorion peroxidase like protein n=1 Tax=Argiope bruennichi TaxID=94029 RepID=A0A8T0EIJ7_ARGBR|nr:Chorion peroxidase like protein [Argiope bruennichi]